MRRLTTRMLAAALGFWLALNMGRCALGCLSELRTAAALRQSIAETEAQLDALARSRSLSGDEVRIRAFRQAGLVGPEDVVFFDGGS